ncbi:hypothetical protein [Alienimonas chondri]|nr:hypothetical protein [Alienimonas chondri]
MTTPVENVIEETPHGAKDAEPAEATASPFIEQELDQLGSPFTRETVLELNEIVARSLTVIERFDEVRMQSDAATAPVSPGEVYGELSERADRARADLNATATRLRDSDERHNAAILAAMVRFVDGVDREIREEIALTRHLPGRPE